MKIAFLYDTLYPYTRGGAERRYWELARQLRSEHEVHMISWQYWEGPAHILRDGIWFHGVGQPRGLYNESGVRTIREAVDFGVLVGRLAGLPRFDVIDCCAFPFFHLYLASLISKLRRTPFVVTWHEYWGKYWNEYLDPRRGPLARAIERSVVPFADGYIAVSDHTARRLRTLGGCRAPIATVPNGIEFEAFATPQSRTAEWDVLYVGRLIAHKRVDLLLHALAELRDRSLPVRCLIVGGGPQQEFLQSLAADLGIDDQVTFAGALTDEEVRSEMWSSRMFVLPSAREGFGMAVLEAAACGIASVVVRSPLSASEELIEDGVTGVLADATPSALADAIAALVTDESTARRLGDAAQVRAREYDWSTVAASALSVYTQAMRA